MHEQDIRWSRETAQQPAPNTSVEHPTAPQPTAAPPPVTAPASPSPFAPPGGSPPGYGGPSYGSAYPGTPVTNGTGPNATGSTTAPVTGAPVTGSPGVGSPGFGSPGVGSPYSQQPLSGPPFSQPPLSGPPYPQQPLSGPPFQPPPFGPGGTQYHPYQPAAQPSSGRAGRVVLVLVAAMALSLASGAVGGLIVHSASDNSGPTTVINRQNAPQVDRSSVAGVAEAVLPSVVDITTGEGEGSGVIMSADGAIITNNHVVAGANGSQVTVTFSNGKTAKASIVGTDPLGDIAVIKAQGVSGLTAAKFGDSDAARVGDTVLAIGSPLGLQGSVSEGIISALHRTISEGADQQGGSAKSISDALQTDAAINPGNSGGALVNLAGEVVGINTAIATSGGQSSGNIGVGFAISSNRAKAAADTLLGGGKVAHPFLGVQLSDGNAGGAIIADVVAGGPAAKGGLQKGDIVTKIDSQAIGDATALINVVQSHKVGDKLNLTVNRNGTETQLTVTLGDTPQ